MLCNFLLYLIGLIFLYQKSHAQLLKAGNHEIKGFTKTDEGRWTGPYTFIQGADPQPGLIDLLAGGNGSVWIEDIRRLNEAVSDVNSISNEPKFFFISGDLVNAFPGEEPDRQKQINDVMASLATLQIPTMVISGNHDLLNIPTKDSMEAYRKQWGDDYYKFYCGGVVYIALNSQYFYDSSQVEDLAREQMEWLKNELNGAKSDQSLHHIVIMMHIPIFLVQGDEPDDYFNVPLPLRTELLNLFLDAGVEIVFSGHYHRNAGGFWTAGKRTIESVVNSAIGAQIGDDDSGLRIVTVGKSNITHKYYSLEELPNVLRRGIEL